MAKNKLELSENLENFRDEMEKTIQPFTQITDEKSEHRSVRESKFGGQPYWPKSMEFPKSKTDQMPLECIAQINFKETPSLESFPKKGILQIFICK